MKKEDLENITLKIQGQPFSAGYDIMADTLEIRLGRALPNDSGAEKIVLRFKYAAWTEIAIMRSINGWLKLWR